MALFGGSPGIGGGMFPNDNPFGVPDYMSGINDAFAQNAALGQQKPKNGIGEFLRILAGTFGDNLTGNPVYSRHMQGEAERKQQEAEARRQAEWYERKRKDELTDYGAKKEIDAQFSAPDLPGIIEEFTVAQQMGMVPPGMSYTDYMTMRFPGAQTPVILPHNAQQVGGGNAALPSVSNEAEYNALPPGATYRDPSGRLRRKGGQSGAGPAGGFP